MTSTIPVLAPVPSTPKTAPVATPAPAANPAPATRTGGTLPLPSAPRSVGAQAAVDGALMIQVGIRPNMRAVEAMPRGAERKAAAWNALVENAKTSQAPFISLAESLKASGAIQGYETLVSPNMLVVTPTRAKSGEVLEAFKGVGAKAIYDAEAKPLFPVVPLAPASGGPRVTKGPWWGMDLVRKDSKTSSEAPVGSQWGLGMLGAQKAWEQGADGNGLVYGSIDTGADYTHEALANAYRGKQADGSVDHNYSWFDASGKSAVAKDYDEHGTHTIGSVVGEVREQPRDERGRFDGPVAVSSLGVAPKAKWISAYGLTGKSTDLLKAIQWMQAPTKTDGSAPDPSRAPDVVGMSWWTGPGYSDFFKESLQNLISAGIEPIKSAGNKGPGPETISAPGQFKEIMAIAAVGEDGQIADFSSRGPSPLPHTGRTPEWKPDFAAPGVDVLSSTPGNKYKKFSGTSMAQPHFSGVVLSLLSKYPGLTHDQITKVLADSAVDAGAKGRDLEFGYGIVNIPGALAAADKLFAPRPVVPTPAPAAAKTA